ncbi:MAG: ribose-phosphate diphosphokinase [Candidatus Levyibacteriota bacterium]
MKLFSGSSNKPLAEKISKGLDTSLSPVELFTFPDGEKRVMVPTNVVGEDCVVVQPTSPPVDSNVMELFFIIDALKRTGAKTVTTVIPYFGYERQDHVFRDGEARSLEVITNILAMQQVDRVIGLDFHSVKVPEIFKIPVTHLSALPLFAENIKKMGWAENETVLVTPDMGGLRRIEILSEMMGGIPYVSVEKNRDLESGNIESTVFHGKLKKRAVIVDDIIASGKTIVAATNLLLENGVEEVVVMASHAVFAPEAPLLLQNSKTSKIFVTDSIHISKSGRFPKLEILSVAPLISKTLRA